MYIYIVTYNLQNQRVMLQDMWYTTHLIHITNIQQMTEYEQEQ